MNKSVAERVDSQPWGPTGPRFSYSEREPAGCRGAFTTLPDLMHRVQARIRLGLPSISALTGCRLGYQRRFVLLFAWLTLCPKDGPLPQISHTRAIVRSRKALRRVEKR